MSPTDFSAAAPGRLVQNLAGQLTFLPNPLPPKIDWNDAAVDALTRATGAIASLSAKGEQFPKPERLFRLFMQREAEFSSRIEQTFASVRAIVLAEAIPDAPVLNPDLIEVQNNHQILSVAVGIARDRYPTPSDLCGLNRILFQGTAQQANPSTGEFRRVQNWVGSSRDIHEARFVPPPPHEVEPAVRQLCDYLSSKTKGGAVLQAALAHYQFEAIHPFVDGNGRIGRALILWILLASGALSQPLLNPSAGLERQRQDYYQHLLNVSVRGEWSHWIRFFSESMTTEATRAIQVLDRLETLRSDFITRVSRPRFSPHLRDIIDALFDSPWLTSNRAAQLAGCSAPQGVALLNRLAKLGIVKEVTGKMRSRVYLAEDVLNLFQD